jgi:DNA (cytosine-5)-methyltransferase 1
VNTFNPGYVVVENVPGVLKQKKKIRLVQLLLVKKNNYKVHFDNHDISEVWCTSKRKRFTLIANRISNIEFHSKIY